MRDTRGLGLGTKGFHFSMKSYRKQFLAFQTEARCTKEQSEKRGPFQSRKKREGVKLSCHTNANIVSSSKEIRSVNFEVIQTRPTAKLKHKDSSVVVNGIEKVNALKTSKRGNPQTRELNERAPTAPNPHVITEASIK